MNEKTKVFLDELKALCQKHDVIIDEEDHYDSTEQYTGTDYHFMGAFDEKEENYLIWLGIKDVLEYISN